MEQRNIEIGQEYGYREMPNRHSPLEHVRVLDRVRSKWKVEWIEPNHGLVDYVESGQLLVPWKEQRALLKEEASRERIREHNERHGYDHDGSPVAEALQQGFRECR